MPGCLSILLPVLRRNRNKHREKSTSFTQDLMQREHEHPDNASEQGAPYPVLIRGHSLRKTRAPPSATSQLDENFDAITQDGMTTARPPLRHRDWETERTSSPLDEDFDLMTSSGGATTERGSTYRNLHPLDGGYKHTTAERSPVYSPDGSRMGGSGSGAQGPSRHGTITRSTSGAHGRHGSAPQFEVVKSQVVEDGPERTVTVSLWKEQVAKPIGPNGETMSVHYYSAQDVLPDVMYTNETRGRRDDYATPSEAGDTRPLRDKTSSPRDMTPSERNYRHRSPQSPGPSVAGNRSDIYYGQSPPRMSTPMRGPGAGQPSTPTYSPQRTSPSPQNNSPARLAAHHLDNSISTIKSLPTIEMEKILDSCEPSLVHVAPILACLGITREEHLRAIIRLSEETRDKEVKEEALRLGMTVMEWAILLDRLHSL